MKLIGKRGPALGSEWTIKKPRASIGRDTSCDIYLDDPKVSRFHAELVRRDNHYVLVDSNSTNGCFIDGMRVTEGVLREGQTVKIGNSEMAVAKLAPAEEFEWEETISTIMAEVPVDALRESAELARPALEADLRKASEASDGRLTLDSKRLRSLHKLVKHLDTIYDLSSVLGSIMSKEQLLNAVIEKVIQIFPKAERACILLEDPKEPGNYKPVAVRQNDQSISGEFRISRSIFERALNDRVGVLATDATSDDRFQAAESIVNMQLKSCLCAPMVVKGEAMGALYLDNCSQAFCFDKDDVELLGAFATQAGMAIRNAQLYENIQRSYHQSILALINTIEAKDPYTMGHTQRTMRYALGIAKHLGQPENEIKKLREAAQLHDIGKIGVREAVLQKAGALTDDEYSDMKAHVVIGCRILEPIDYLKDIIPIIRSHHEKYDGSGYPDKLAGEDIPLGARILALADAFDAMTTQRPYNKPLSFQQALARCRETSAKHFDPACIDALGDFLEETQSGRGAEMAKASASAEAGASSELGS